MPHERPTLTWMGGPLPVSVPPTLDIELHALVAGGSLRCPCGDHHDTPPPSDIILRVVHESAAAELTVCATGGSVWIRGIAGPDGEQSLARHVLSILGGGLLGEGSAETLDLLLEASELELAVFPGDASELRESLLSWLRPHGVPGHARLCFVGDAHRLRAVCDLVSEASALVARSLIAQIVPHEEVTELSTLASVGVFVSVPVPRRSAASHAGSSW